MNENFSLLTIVSNNIDNFGAYIAILTCLWVATATEICIFIHSIFRLIRTGNTINAKWWELPVGLILFGSLLTVSFFLTYYDIPVEVWSALVVFACIGLVWLFILYIYKCVNCANAKKHLMSERKWCLIIQAKRYIKRMMARVTAKGLHAITKDMSLKQRVAFYTKLANAVKLLKLNHINFKKAKKRIFEEANRLLQNIKSGKYENFKDFFVKEKETLLNDGLDIVSGSKKNKKKRAK